MADEPPVKRAMAFIDGQNLYQHAKAAFGHHHPNYDPAKLHAAVCAEQGWIPNQVRFYTGIPSREKDLMWAGYWASRLLSMKRMGIIATSRPLRYRDETITVDGQWQTISTPQEKGIDIRIALDIVSRARTKQFDVAVIYSQDQDLCEAVEEVKAIAREQDRWIGLACAFPSSPTATSSRGVDATNWVRIERAMYDACLDPRDFRPRS